MALLDVVVNETPIALADELRARRVFFGGGAGTGGAGTMPAGTQQLVSLQVDPFVVPPQILNVQPAIGTSIPRWQIIQFDAIDNLDTITILDVQLEFALGTKETVFTLGGGFATPYAVGSSSVRILNGYHFAIARRTGWTETPIKLILTVVDADGNEAVLVV